MFETSVEAYYKYLWNQVEFGESAVPSKLKKIYRISLFLAEDGATAPSFWLKKNKGKWTGWVGYTLSWA